MMKTNTINPPSSSSSSSFYDNHYENFEANFIKFYPFKKGSGVVFSPIFLWTLGLTSIITLFLFYSPNTPFGFTSSYHHTFSLFKPLEHNHEDGKCDLFKGKWVHDLNVSQYTSSSCKTIPYTKNCFEYGRKDTDFLNWRWQPDDCELSRFDPNNFLQIVRGRKLAFIGDSLARNHMESLLCLLSQVETPTDVYKDSEDRVRTWHFPSSNFTLMVLWAKYLVKADERMVNNTGSGIFDLHLDVADRNWTDKLPDLDYAILSAGQWFLRETYLYDQGELTGCVYCDKLNITKFGPDYALRMSIRGALRHLNECKECNKDLLTFVRTFSPSHYENGDWNTGGGCNRTGPYISEETAKEKTSGLQFAELELEELEMARKDGMMKGRRFRGLDTTRAMLMRPDGHPNMHYRWMQGYNDCVHWCLPGPIDMWSSLLLAVLQQE